MTTVSRYPIRLATMARAMPVFPEVGSRMVFSGVSSPDARAASIIRFAMRSLSEPLGFCPSSLPHSRTPGFGLIRGRPTSGVSPMASRMSPYRTRSIIPAGLRSWS